MEQVLLGSVKFLHVQLEKSLDKGLELFSCFYKKAIFAGKGYLQGMYSLTLRVPTSLGTKGLLQLYQLIAMRISRSRCSSHEAGESVKYYKIEHTVLCGIVGRSLLAALYPLLPQPLH